LRFIRTRNIFKKNVFVSQFHELNNPPRRFCALAGLTMLWLWYICTIWPYVNCGNIVRFILRKAAIVFLLVGI
jgi:hypothetical protein